MFRDQSLEMMVVVVLSILLVLTIAITKYYRFNGKRFWTAHWTLRHTYKTNDYHQPEKRCMFIWVTLHSRKRLLLLRIFFFIRHCDRCYIILLLLSVIEFVRWVKCGCHNCFIMCNAFSTFTFWPFPLWRRRWHFPFIQFLYFIETLRIVGCRNHLGFCSYYSFTKKKLFGY